jgi:fluoride exporter
MRAYDPREFAAVFAGGAVGALARAGVSEWLTHSPTSWPWATFVVNMAGAFVLGYLATRIQVRPPRSELWRPLIGPGFCGALTTFSTLQLELVRMLDHGRDALATGYGAATVVGGLLAVVAASAIARRARTVA